MPKTYSYNDNSYSEEQVLKAADAKGMSLQDYTQEYDVIEIDLTSKEIEPLKVVSSSEYSTPSDVLGLDIKGDNSSLSFFNSSEKVTAKKLRELYPGFVFKEKLLGEDGGLDAITVSTKDGAKSTSFDVNISGMNTIKNEQQGRNRAFDILTKFVKENFTQENQNAQTKAKIQRTNLFTETNNKRDELAAPVIAEIQKDFDDGKLFFKEEDRVSEIGEYGGKYSNVQRVIKAEQPYEKELQQALKQLKIEFEDKTPTKEQVEKRALELIINDIQEKKLIEIIESVDYQSNSENHYFGDDATKSQRYEIAAKEFKIDFQKDLNIYTLKDQELKNGKDAIRLNEINSIIENEDLDFEITQGEKVLQLKNGKLIPESILNEYLDLNSLLNNKRTALNKFAAVLKKGTII